MIALYKPDRYSRLQYFLDGFAKSLNEADQAIVLDFPANARPEDETITVTIDDLLNKLNDGMLLDISEESAKNSKRWDQRSICSCRARIFIFFAISLRIICQIDKRCLRIWNAFVSDPFYNNPGHEIRLIRRFDNSSLADAISLGISDPQTHCQAVLFCF